LKKSQLSRLEAIERRLRQDDVFTVIREGDPDYKSAMRNGGKIITIVRSYGLPIKKA